MSLLELLDQLGQLNITLRAEDGQLRIQAPQGAFTPELRSLVAQYKGEILAHLQQTNSEPTSLPPIVPSLKERYEPFPLTDIQHAYWIGQMVGLDLGNAYHFYQEVDSRNLDIARLNQAWQRLIERHDTLRAVVLTTGNQQIFADVPAYQIEVKDVSHLEAVEKEAHLETTREEMAHQILTLSEWPLFDIRVSQVTPEYARIHISMAMIMMDGRSLQQLMGEWNALYLNPDLDLPKLTLSYRDYVVWNRALEETPHYQQAQSYWMDRLDTLPPAPKLPAKRNQTVDSPTQNRASQDVSGQDGAEQGGAEQDGAEQDEAKFVHRSHFLEKEKWQVLSQRAQQAGITPTSLLAATFAEVLTLWSEQPQFTINCTFFNRPVDLHPELDDILGDFTAATLLEVDNTQGNGVIDRAKQIHRRLWQDLENRAFNGVRVIQALTSKQKNQVGALMPIVFTSMLGVKNQPEPAQPNGEAQSANPEEPTFLDGSVSYNITQTPQVSLDYQVNEIDGGLAILWDAVDGYFPDGLIAHMFDAYTKLLDQLLEDSTLWGTGHESSRDSDDLQETLLPPQHLNQLAEINDTTGKYPEETLHGLLGKQAKLHPDALAIITTEKRLTYGELHQRAVAVAHWLQKQNGGEALPADSLVAIVMEKGWEQIVSVFGTLMAGGAYVPIDPTLPTGRQHYIIEQGEVNYVLTQSWLEGALTWPEEISVAQRLVVDAQSVADDLPPLALNGSPSDLAYVLYTSGSTGSPKGVMIEHRNVVNRMSDIAQRFGLTPADRAIALTALHHDLSIFDIFCMLSIVGGAIVMPDASLTRDPKHWAEIMTQQGVTLWNSVPAFMQMLVEYVEYATSSEDASPEGSTNAMPPYLRWVILSGDFIPVTLPDRLRALQPQVEIISSGGPTETTVWDIFYPIEQVDPRWPSIPYGKPLKNAHYYVMDEQLQIRPFWVPGELCIGGAGLARGYWKDEEKTNEKFVIHPQTGERLYRSGDLGRFMADGNLEILGRTDFQVKIRGQRIELGEIEAHLLQHPDVREAVVNAVDDSSGRRQLAAYVVLEGEEKEGDSEQSTPSGAPASQLNDQASQSMETVPIDQLRGVTVYDPIERLVFKLEKQGVRKFKNQLAGQNSTPDTPLDNLTANGNGSNPEAESLATIHLPKPQIDEDFQAEYLARQSYRYFINETISLETLSQFLTCMMPLQLPGAPLPKYRYPSAGGLYPIQSYLYIKEGRVEGLGQGFYYYQPVDHQLVLLTVDNDPEGSLVEGLFPGANQAIFDQAAFGLFLVGAMDAIQPMYGELAESFSQLEAGYISQLLMMEAPKFDFGLCPIGGTDQGRLDAALKLTQTHQLLHSLAGGRIDPIQKSQWLQPSEGVGTSSPSAAASADSSILQAHFSPYLAERLPEHMIPTLYTQLDALPLNANGKVDRKALSEYRVDAPIIAFEAPGNELEEKLSVILQEIGGLQEVSVTQNFADLGLNSVHMVTINNQLQERLQREISIAALFEYTTIRDLAQHLATESGQDEVKEPASGTRQETEQAGGQAPVQPLPQSEEDVAQALRSDRAQARLANRQRRR
ncbi:MAG: amino acid adenylation domain-containing protein [Chloroflexota bacterium]